MSRSSTFRCSTDLFTSDRPSLDCNSAAWAALSSTSCCAALSSSCNFPWTACRQTDTNKKNCQHQGEEDPACYFCHPTLQLLLELRAVQNSSRREHSSGSCVRMLTNPCLWCHPCCRQLCFSELLCEEGVRCTHRLLLCLRARH